MSNKRVEAGASAGEEWLSAREVLDVILRRVPYGHANETVCLLAREGILRARAARFRSGGHELRDVYLSSDFWSGVGMPHMREDWTAGVLESLIDDDLNSETATGVQFLRADVDDYLATTANPEHPSADRSVETTAKTGGRRLSTDWFEWIAEAVATVHELGVPDGHGSEGQAELRRRVEDGLARRGLEGPGRTTVQPAVNAILRRLREGPQEDRNAAKKPG